MTGSREKSRVQKSATKGSIPVTRLYAAGVIAKVFGVKGELKLHSYSRSADEFRALGRVLVGKNEAHAVALEIEQVVLRGRDIYIKFRNIGDRNASARLIGHFLFVEEADRKSLSSGEYFVDDIVGLEVRDSAGNRLGTVQDVLSYPAHDVYLVRSGGTDIMVPAVREIIRTIDLAGRVMIVDPPEGMFEGTPS